MRPVPWWAILSSVCAPVLLIGGWALAAALQPSGYDPVTQTISALAAQGAADRWLMTGALIALGLCHVVTALGLRAAAPAGRIALACGGAASILVASFPEPGGGGTSAGHIAATAVALAALAIWPSLAAMRGAAGSPRRSAATPWALRPALSAAVSVLLVLCAGWFLLELHSHGAAGFAERVLTGAQAFWPLIVVLACLRLGRDRGPDADSAAQDSGQARLVDQ
jgi:hypothetical membrane protein